MNQILPTFVSLITYIYFLGDTSKYMSGLLDRSADLKRNSSILLPEITFHGHFTISIPVYTKLIEVFMINDVPL